MNDTVRSAQSEICLEESGGRKKEQGQVTSAFKQRNNSKMLLQNLKAESLYLKASPAFEKY